MFYVFARGEHVEEVQRSEAFCGVVCVAAVKWKPFHSARRNSQPPCRARLWAWHACDKLLFNTSQLATKPPTKCKINQQNNNNKKRPEWEGFHPTDETRTNYSSLHCMYERFILPCSYCSHVSTFISCLPFVIVARHFKVSPPQGKWASWEKLPVRLAIGMYDDCQQASAVRQKQVFVLRRQRRRVQKLSGE